MAKRTVSLVECSVRSWATHEGVLPWEMLEHIVNGTARGERVAEQIDFDQQVDQRSDEWATWRTWLAWRRARHEEHKLAGLPRDVKGAREMWHTLVNAATRIRDHSLRYTGYDDPTLMRDTLEMPPRQAAFILCSAPKHATYVMGTLDEVARVPFGPSPEHVPAVPPPAVGEDRFRQEDFIATCAESQSWDDVRILLAQTQSRFGDAPASPSTRVPAEAWEQVESFGGYVVLSDAAFDRLRAPDATARQRRCELESAVIPTAYAGRGCKAWELSTRVPWGSQHVAGTSLKRLNADAWASLMGAPLHSIDGVRRCMDMLSAESAKHAAIAQGQHAGVVQAVMEHAFEGVEPTNGTNYTFVDVYSGIGVGLEGISAPHGCELRNRSSSRGDRQLPESLSCRMAKSAERAPPFMYGRSRERLAKTSSTCRASTVPLVAFDARRGPEHRSSRRRGGRESRSVRWPSRSYEESCEMCAQRDLSVSFGNRRRMSWTHRSGGKR